MRPGDCQVCGVAQAEHRSLLAAGRGCQMFVPLSAHERERHALLERAVVALESIAASLAKGRA